MQDERHQVDDYGWIPFSWRNGTPAIPFPNVCVSCLANTDRRKVVYFGRYGSRQISMGFCETCDRIYRRRQARILLPILIPLTIVSVSAFVLIGRQTGRWTSGATLSPLVVLGFGSMIATIAFDARYFPLRLSMSRRWIRFKNPAFASIYRTWAAFQAVD
jgi:hypothetical protein